MGISLIGKLFVGTLSIWTANKVRKMRVTDDPEVLKKLADAINSSPIVKRELAVPGATLDSVYKKLGLAWRRGKDFEEATGVKWPLDS